MGHEDIEEGRKSSNIEGEKDDDGDDGLDKMIHECSRKTPAAVLRRPAAALKRPAATPLAEAKAKKTHTKTHIDSATIEKCKGGWVIKTVPRGGRGGHYKLYPARAYAYAHILTTWTYADATSYLYVHTHTRSKRHINSKGVVFTSLPKATSAGFKM